MHYPTSERHGRTDPSTVASIVLGSVVFLGLFQILYRLLFHPLAGVPGPFLQRISGLPRIWQCRRGNRHPCELRAHERYGSVVRIGPDYLSFRSLSTLKAIHVNSANVFKGDEFYGLLDGGAHGGVSIQMTRDSDAHMALCKVMDHAMPSRDLTFKTANELAQRFVAVMGREAGDDGYVDANKVASWYSFDLIGVLGFDQPMDMMDSDRSRWLPQCLQDAVVFLYWAGFARGATLWRWFLGNGWPARLGMHTAMSALRYSAFADNQVFEREARLMGEFEGKRPRNMFGQLIRSNFVSSLDLRADSSLLIAAGSDAIRLTISATLFHWSRDADVMAKAVGGVRGCCADPTTITDSKLNSLRYLRAFTDETMRLNPPKPSSTPREVDSGGIVADGIAVPAGMTVGTCTYALHRDAAIYPEPHAYRPERWLQEPRDARMQTAFSPFFKGPRACPGKAIAYLAMQLALFHLMYRYEMQGTGGGSKAAALEAGGFQFSDWIVGYARGPVVRLRRRQDGEA